MTAEEGWVGIEEVAAHLRVAKESIYRWVDSKGFRPTASDACFASSFQRWTSG